MRQIIVATLQRFTVKGNNVNGNGLKSEFCSFYLWNDKLDCSTLTASPLCHLHHEPLHTLQDKLRPLYTPWDCHFLNKLTNLHKSIDLHNLDYFLRLIPEFESNALDRSATTHLL